MTVLVANEDNAIPLRYSLCTAPDMVQVGDMDGDGDLDVAVVCDNAPAAVLWLQNEAVNKTAACLFHYAPVDTTFPVGGDTAFPYNRVLVVVGVVWIVAACLVLAYVVATALVGVWHFYEHALPEERTPRNLRHYLTVAFHNRVLAPGRIADSAEVKATDVVARILHRSLSGPARYHVMHVLMTAVWLLAAASVAVASTSTAWLVIEYDTFTLERSLWRETVEDDDESDGAQHGAVVLARAATLTLAVVAFAFAGLLLASLAVPAHQRGVVVPRAEVAVGVATLGLGAFLATAVVKFFLQFRTTLWYLTTGYYLAWVAVVLVLIPGFGLIHIAWRDHRWLNSYTHVPVKESEIEIQTRATRLTDSLRSRLSNDSDVEVPPPASAGGPSPPTPR